MAIKKLFLSIGFAAATVVGANAQEISVTKVSDKLDSTPPYLIITINQAFNQVIPTSELNIYKDGGATPVSTTRGANAFYAYGRTATNKMFYVYPAEDYVFTPGTYTFEVSENSFYNSVTGASSSAFSFEYVVEGMEELPFTSVPENGGTVLTTDDYDAVSLTYKDYEYDASTPGAGSASVYFSNDTLSDDLVGTVDASAVTGSATNPATLSFDLGLMLNQVGTYRVEVPTGFFYIVPNSGGEPVSNAALTLTFKVKAPANPLTWTVEPAPGEVDEISTVRITFNKAVSLKGSRYTSVYCSNSRPVYEADGSFAKEGAGTIVATFSPVFATGGLYAVRLLADQYSCNEGDATEEVLIVYNVNGALPVSFSPDAETIVNRIDETTVSIAYVPAAEKTDIFRAYYTNGRTVVPANFVRLVNYDFEKPTRFTVAPAEPITRVGEWQLIVEPGSIDLISFGERMGNPEIRGTFIVDNETGVDFVGSEPVGADIYTSTGVCVKRGAAKSDLRNLPAGLYIFGGEKVVVK